MKIISKRQQGETAELRREFIWPDTQSGFSFEAFDSADGPQTICRTPESLENFKKCTDGTFDVVDLGYVKRVHNFNIPAVGERHCGTHVTLDGFTNTCENCGTDYNSAGQQLADRSQWGEETGEHPSDILRIK